MIPPHARRTLLQRTAQPRCERPVRQRLLSWRSCWLQVPHSWYRPPLLKRRETSDNRDHPMGHTRRGDRTGRASPIFSLISVGLTARRPRTSARRHRHQRPRSPSGRVRLTGPASGRVLSVLSWCRSRPCVCGLGSHGPVEPKATRQHPSLSRGSPRRPRRAAFAARMAIPRSTTLPSCSPTRPGPSRAWDLELRGPRPRLRPLHSPSTGSRAPPPLR